MFLFYLRHGDPIYNPDSLTPLGHRQAEALAHRLARYGLDEIYASSSNRAMLTAQPTCELLKKEKVILDWANEGYVWSELVVPTPEGGVTWGFHDEATKQKWQTPEIVNLGKKWYEHPDYRDTKFKSGILRVQRETDAFLESLGYRHIPEENRYEAIAPNDKRIALFAHQGFGLAFLSCVLDIPYPMFSTHFDMGHSGMTVIHFENKEGFVVPKVLQLANDSHIYDAGLPTQYQNLWYF